MNAEEKVIADPHGLLERPDETGVLREVAAKLGCSRHAVRDIVSGRSYSVVRYVDVRREGTAPINTRRYCIEDVRAVLPSYFEWRKEKQARGVALDAKRTEEARAAKAEKLAKQGLKAPKPSTPKPAAAPKPRPPTAPKVLPPLVARGRKEPEIFFARRVSR